MPEAKRKKKRQKTTEASRDENVLAMYLNDVSRSPLLSREEEEHYARRAAKGDKQAKDMLAKANLRFVIRVAKKYQNQGLPLADLISEGNIGLMKAIERYDVDKGYHFISYAVWWIRQAILRALYEKTRAIRLPLNRVAQLSRIQKKRRELQRERGEEPDIREVAAAVGLDAELVTDLISISREHVSLDSPVGYDEDAARLADFVEDPTQKGPEATAIEHSLADEINNLLQSLSRREAEIIQHRFGLNGRQPLTLQEIGDRYDLSKERIRQIEKRALQKLKQPEKKERLREFVA